MPLYQWVGIDLEGNIKKGMDWASSQEVLSDVLLKKEIAVLSVKYKRIWLWYKPINLRMKAQFFSHMGQLLETGITIDRALNLIGTMHAHKAFALIIKDIEYDVMHGIAIYDALKKFPDVFDNLSFALIKAGYESGALPEALLLLHEHIEMRHHFVKRLRNALLMPAITFAFFITVLLIVSMAIVPTFADLFKNLGKEIPASVYYLLYLSEANIWWILIIIFLIVLLFFLILKKRVKHFERVDAIIDGSILSIPLFGPIIAYMQSFYFLQSFSLLVRAGILVPEALYISLYALSNSWYKKQLDSVRNAIKKGESLTQALQSTNLFSPDIKAIIAVGEETGQLGLMTSKAAKILAQTIEQRLSFITTAIQPMLMVILGLLVLGLVLSVYIPILDISGGIA